MNYQEYISVKQQLGNLLTRTAGIIKDHALESGNSAQHLAEYKESIDNDTLNVLVMGQFSTGKSTFLNAMLGVDLLPEDDLPTTAVMTEIHESADWKFTLFPKDPQQAPLEVSRDEMREKIVIDNFALDDEPENPFAKLLVGAPIQLCRNGVDIVDSPGLNDPDAHEKVTLEYITKSDAVIYLMSSQQAYTALDQEMILRLRNQGYKSIIFGITRFDQLQPAKAERFKTAILSRLEPLTDLGRDGVFFINSLGAKNAKIAGDRDSQALQDFLLMERSIEKILTEKRAPMKLSKVFAGAETILKDVDALLKAQQVNLNQDKSVLLRNIAQAEADYKNAAIAAQVVMDKYKVGIRDVLTDVKPVIGKLPEILAENMEKYKKTDRPIRCVEMMDFKKSMQKFCNETLQKIRSHLNTDMTEWNNQVLTPFLTDRINALQPDNELYLEYMRAAQRRLGIELDIIPGQDKVNQSVVLKGLVFNGLLALSSLFLMTLSPYLILAVLTGISRTSDGVELIAQSAIYKNFIAGLRGKPFKGPDGKEMQIGAGIVAQATGTVEKMLLNMQDEFNAGVQHDLEMNKALIDKAKAALEESRIEERAAELDRISSQNKAGLEQLAQLSHLWN